MARLSLGQALALARQHLEAGRIQQAQTICQAILESDPEQVVAHQLTGVGCRLRGDFIGAAEHLQQAARLAVNDANLWEEAGGLLEAVSRWAQAEEATRKALALDAKRPEAENTLGNVLQAQGRLDEAEAAYRRALELDGNADRIWSNFGALLQRQGRLAEAEQAYRRSLAIQPLQAGTLANLGSLLRQLGRMEEAEAHYRRAIAIQPLAAGYFNLGVLLQSQHKPDEAEAAYQRTLECAPGHVKALYNLATLRQRPGRFDEAEETYRRVLELDPHYAAAAMNLGTLLHWTGRLEEAEQALRRALAIEPDYVSAHSNLLVNLQCQPGVTPAALLQSHLEWDRRRAARLTAAAPPPRNSADPRRPLRLGLVSPDFGRHPVGFFLVSVLEALRGADAEVVCYSDRAEDDDLTPRIRAAASLWRPTRSSGARRPGRTDPLRRDRHPLRSDRPHRRQPPAGLRPQASPHPDHLDRLPRHDRPGGDRLPFGRSAPCSPQARRSTPRESAPHARGLRLLCPAGLAPAVGPLPAASAGHVTFGSFNNLSKINAELVALWAEILDRVPRSRLFSKYAGLEDAGVRSRYERMFAEHHVAADRLSSPAGRRPKSSWSATTGSTWPSTRPYSGGLTTCEALWMGVPVVTWPGATFAGRHSLSHLSAAALQGTIARDAAAYVQIAVDLAGDPDRRAGLRGSLREQVAASPLCDAPRFAADLLRVLRQAWADWCQTRS